jgi:hypothetical protein
VAEGSNVEDPRSARSGQTPKGIAVDVQSEGRYLSYRRSQALRPGMCPDQGCRRALPSSSDSSVLKKVAGEDAATATFQAVGAGVAILMTSGNCSSPETSQFNGPCPVLRIEVNSPQVRAR